MNVYLSFSKLDFFDDDGDDFEDGGLYRPVYLKRQEFTFLRDKFTLYDTNVLAKQAAEWAQEAESTPTDIDVFHASLVAKRNGRIFQESFRVSGAAGASLGQTTFLLGFEKITGHMNRMFERVDEENNK